MKWMEQLTWFLNLPLTSSKDEIVEHLNRVIEAVTAESVEASEELPEAVTFASAAGFVPESEVQARIQAALEEGASGETVAAAPLLKLLGLEDGAELAEVTARVMELKHPENLVPREELEQVQARLAELDETEKKNRIDRLIASNEAKIPPSMRDEIRELAETDFPLAERTVAKLPEQKPKRIAEGSDPDLPEGSVVEATVTVGGREFEVNPDSAKLAASIRAIAKDKGLSYEAATAEYWKQQDKSKSA